MTPNKKKIFVLDTNVILHDNACIYQFSDNDVVIPITVLEELDQFKKVYDDRVRSLTPSSVRIRIADDRSLSEYTEKFDVVLRVVRSSLQHGFFSQRLMRKDFEILRDFPDPVPFDTVVASFVMSERCVTMLKKIQAVVV